MVFALGEFQGEGPYGERLEMFCSILFISNYHFYNLSQRCPEETFSEIKKNMKRKSPDPVYLSTMLLKRCILQTLLSGNEAESNVGGKCIICKRKQFGLDG